MFYKLFMNILLKKTKSVVKIGNKSPIDACFPAQIPGTHRDKSTDITKSRNKIISYLYKTKGTCSTQIEVDLDGNIIKNVRFTGGCDGNLKAIPRLVEGMTVEEVEKRISGIHCGMKNTSCGDQLAKALRAAYEAECKN